MATQPQIIQLAADPVMQRRRQDILAQTLAGQAQARTPGQALSNAGQLIGSALLQRGRDAEQLQGEQQQQQALSEFLLGGPGSTAGVGRGGPEIQPGTGAEAQLPTGPGGMAPGQTRAAIAAGLGPQLAQQALQQQFAPEPDPLERQQQLAELEKTQAETEKLREPDRSPDEQLAIDMGFEDGLRSPGATRAVAEFNKAQKVGQVTNVNLPAEARENPWTETGITEIKEQSKQLQEATQINARLEQAKQALQEGAATGPGQEALLPFRRFMAGIGLADAETLEATELFQAAASYLIPRFRVAGSGSTSDVEITLFAQAVPNMARSKGGNLRIIEGFEKIQKRALQELELKEAMIEDGTYSPSKFRRRADEEFGPVFDTETKDELADFADQSGAEQQQQEAPPVADPAQISSMSKEELNSLRGQGLENWTDAMLDAAARRLDELESQ